jgi:hypothetical protein
LHNKQGNPQGQPHKQVLTKVNAYVDEDIKPLIEILNTLDKVWTFESCQRNRLNRGWVMLYYGDESTRQEEIIKFAKRLVAAVKKQIVKSNKLYPDKLFPILGDTLISIEWSEGKSPYLYINFASDEIKQVTSIFSDIVRDIHDSRSYK